MLNDLRPDFRTTRQTLLFDADDTLWENNVLFERAIAGFIELLAHPTWSAEEVRAAFNTLEHERVAVHGYGAASFRDSLLAAVERFHGRPVLASESDRIHELAGSILHAPMELLADVDTTLRELSGRHTLVLMTKGDIAEQRGKLERSGLAPLFSHVEVVREKHREAYFDLRSRHRHDATTTWMIGNSPKSDVNPALAAGLHAIYLPHPNTWVLEHEEVLPAPAGQFLFHLERFSDLLRLF